MPDRFCENSNDKTWMSAQFAHSVVTPVFIPITTSWHRRFATRFARIDSRESFAIDTPIFIARQADSHESLEFPIRANHPIRANRANRFTRITPLRITRHGYFPVGKAHAVAAPFVAKPAQETGKTCTRDILGSQGFQGSLLYVYTWVYLFVLCIHVSGNYIF